MTFDCPLPATMQDISAITCAQRWDQITMLAFQRIQSTPSFDDSSTLITEVANWTALKAASDATKVIVTPILDSLVIPQSETQEEGGNDNSTPNGIPIYLGESVINVTLQFRNLPAQSIAELRKLVAESLNGPGGPQVWVYMFTKNGKVIGNSSTTKGNVDKTGAYADSGIPIYNFRLGSLGTEGFNQDNKSPASFYMEELWDENWVVATPTDFTPQIDLKN